MQKIRDYAIDFVSNEDIFLSDLSYDEIYKSMAHPRRKMNHLVKQKPTAIPTQTPYWKYIITNKPTHKAKQDFVSITERNRYNDYERNPL